MSRLLPTAFAVLSLASLAGLAHAQGPRGNQDANGDGVISAEEFDNAAKARFQRMDANHDGVIDADELAMIQKRMEERRAERPDAAPRPGGGGGGVWAEMDADHDGKVTEAEALAASRARFAKLDADKNGVLSEAEQPARRGPPN
ncbi:EF-hand domain-containing protein [Caulobacter soli]|uniref:EF-hand domain-containing protein n=1 Tax=Caulobacter soli TaxID=2708539 RepID=UPI0013EAF4B0|nr:EF-hand domain-containing protein [Caulobacter soli]